LLLITVSLFTQRNVEKNQWAKMWKWSGKKSRNLITNSTVPSVCNVARYGKHVQHESVIDFSICKEILQILFHENYLNNLRNPELDSCERCVGFDVLMNVVMVKRPTFLRVRRHAVWPNIGDAYWTLVFSEPPVKCMYQETVGYSAYEYELSSVRFSRRYITLLSLSFWGLSSVKC
jgi:hypothetical protein